MNEVVAMGDTCPKEGGWGWFKGYRAAQPIKRWG